MTPRLFHFGAWHYEPKALLVAGPPTVIDRKLGATSVHPDFNGRLGFNVVGEGPDWEDVLPTDCGLILLSERFVDAFKTQGILGIEFCDAEVLDVIDNPELASREKPKYKWLRAKGLIVYDAELARQGRCKRIIELRSVGAVDFLHSFSDRQAPLYPCGYACNLRVIELCRKLKIGNLKILPYDFVRPWKGPSKPPFQIDLFGNQWPPQWYPDWFTPDPSNSYPKTRS